MITLKQLRWSNAFSYGANNQIDFTQSPLVQLVGKNGHGKSSVALILEEVLYNKNSKGIKKGDILNRHITDKAYEIQLTLDKDGVEYTIQTRRGSTQTVKLLRGTEDISSHTSTHTYKQIENLVGMDHKTFSQIVYQSSASSLEFLTSADTARKKFLIELLNLGKYTQAGEVFKAAAADMAKELAVAQGKVDTITQWIAKYNKQDFTRLELLPVPPQPEAEIREAQTLENTLDDLERLNKKIAQNNKYREFLATITVLPLPPKPTEDAEPYKQVVTECSTQIKAAEAMILKMRKLSGECPTCLSGIDDHNVGRIISEQEAIVSDAKSRQAVAQAKVSEVTQAKTLWEQAQRSQAEWEKYHQLVDDTMQTELLDEGEISRRILELNKVVKSRRAEIAAAEKENTTRVAHNNKLALIEGQLADMQAELGEWTEKLGELVRKHTTLSTLVKTFSTTGLVAYKIENLVKDLEALTNEYLGELSGGRFQISFQISGSDKLNVVITDNGVDIDIHALSGGERARVNVATLLAIRRLMQSLSQSRINLLILDETIEALDVDGKEKLIEVLLAEDNLNTVLVSHGFSHPLLEKVHVVKHNNISRIET